MAGRKEAPEEQNVLNLPKRASKLGPRRYSCRAIMGKLSTIVPAIVANGLLWGWLVLALGMGVINQYARVLTI